MYRIDVTYFDGQSSNSHQAILSATERIDELRLQGADGKSFVWRAEDLDFELYGNYLEIRNKHISGALLQIRDEHFSKQFLEVMKSKGKVDIHRRILSLKTTKIVGIAAVALILMVAGYFYLLPPIAERSVAVIPKSVDIYLGNLFMNRFLDENTIDHTKTTLLKEFAEQINFGNSIPLHFSVVQSNKINAFALPNGQIIVYSGILNKMQCSSELAALLAHEVAHINYRHPTRMLTKKLAGRMLISLIFNNINGVSTILVNNVHQLHSLSYSRKFENEADKKGLKILMDNHIDPNGMVQLFALIERAAIIEVPEIISTHPLTKERKKNMQNIIAQSDYNVLANSAMNTLFAQIRKLKTEDKKL